MVAMWALLSYPAQEFRLLCGSPLQTSTATMDDEAPSSAALKTLNAALEAPAASSAAKSSQNGHRQPSPTEIVAQKLQVR